MTIFAQMQKEGLSFSFTLSLLSMFVCFERDLKCISSLSWFFFLSPGHWIWGFSLPVWLVVCMSNKVINNVSYLEVNLRLFSIVGWWLKVMASMSPGLKWTSTSPLLGSSSNLARKRTSLLMVLWKERKSSTDVGHGEIVDGLMALASLPRASSGGVSSATATSIWAQDVCPTSNEWECSETEKCRRQFHFTSMLISKLKWN